MSFRILFIILLFGAIGLSFRIIKKMQNAEADALLTPRSFYDLKINDIDGKEINFAAYKGKKILCVNVASMCGNTPQYEGLEKLYEKHKDKLVIIGFPCNQFAMQEPGSGKEIKEFCTKTFGVTFPLTEKINVKGDKQNEVYQWLTKKALNGKLDSEVKWNFQKYLISENGEFLACFTPNSSY